MPASTRAGCKRRNTRAGKAGKRLVLFHDFGVGAFSFSVCDFGDFGGGAFSFSFYKSVFSRSNSAVVTARKCILLLVVSSSSKIFDLSVVSSP